MNLSLLAKRRRAFTLAELLVVTAIVATMTALLVAARVVPVLVPSLLLPPSPYDLQKALPPSSTSDRCPVAPGLGMLVDVQDGPCPVSGGQIFRGDTGATAGRPRWWRQISPGVDQTSASDSPGHALPTVLWPGPFDYINGGSAANPPRTDFWQIQGPDLNIPCAFEHSLWVKDYHAGERTSGDTAATHWSQDQ